MKPAPKQKTAPNLEFESLIDAALRLGCMGVARAPTSVVLFSMAYQRKRPGHWPGQNACTWSA